MYCSSCGTPIPDDARFCRSCGKPVAGLPATKADSARAHLTRHLPVLALLWVIYGALRILAGCVMIFAGSIYAHPYWVRWYRPFGFWHSEWPFTHFMLHGLLAGVGLGVMLLGLLDLAAGWGLKHREGWGRILALVLGVLALFRFPLGTALGIYTLWVLVPREAAAEYRRPAAHA